MLSVSRFFGVILTMIIYENIEAMPPAEPPLNQQLLQPQQEQQHNVKSFRNALNQQGIQSLLQSIENRLSNLDQIYSHRYSQRVDLNTDQYVRKIEMLESKVTRLESSLDAQLGKLSENLSSKNFRDDITKDQIFRKIDSIYERFNHKLTYVEEKFDMAFFKLQNRIDMGVTKIERLDDSINVRNADMEAEISGGVQLVKTIKNNVDSLEEKIMNVSRVSSQNFENIANSLSNIENKIVNISHDEYVNNVTKKEPSYKINNMYNELWKKSNIIETNIKNSVEIMNLTRKEIQDIKQTTANSNNQNDDTLDIILDSFKNILQKKFTDLGRKMEDNFKDIIATQNLFLESCKSIQMDETQLERKISLNLEKLLDTLANRNFVSFKELQNTEEIIKMHGNNMERLINQNTNTIMKLSEKTSEDRKKLEKILSSFRKDVANFRTSIEQQIYLDSLESSEIGNLILAQVNDLDKKMNKDNMNYNAKQMPQVDGDVLNQTKDIFAKQVNISAIYNTIKRVDDSASEIRKLLHDIHNKINKCELNATQIHFDLNAETEPKPTDESVDIVFDDETDKNLFRYNYSVIDDNDNKNHNNNNNNIMKLSRGVDVPEASTVPSTQRTNNYDNDNDYDDGIIIDSFSSEENSELNSQEYAINKLNSTNNIISIDNKKENLSNTNIPPADDSGATSKIESNKSGVDVFEELFGKFFRNMPETDLIPSTTELVESDATSKIESSESGVDVFEELYGKFFGSQNMPETVTDSIPSTTELVDNTDLYDDYFI